MEPTVELLNAINQSGGLKIQMVATQDWTQYWLLMLVTVIGSVFIFIYLAMLMKPQISRILAYVSLWRLTRLTGNHVLIIKHTETDLFASSMIDQNTLKSVRAAIKKFDGKAFDLILHTPGGSIFATQLISKLIRSYPGHIRAIIPSYAMSGGAFLTLSCDEILMADTAAVGAIDPQLGYMWHYGSAKSWEEVIRKKHGKAEDGSIQMAYMGKQYTETIRKQITELLADKIPDKTMLEKAAAFLTDGNIEHGKPLLIGDLKDMNVPVAELPADIGNLIDPILNSNMYEGVYWI